MSATLAVMIIGNPTGNVGVSGTVRYYSTIDFTALDGTKYKAGRRDSTDYFLSNTWSVSGGLLTVPSKAGFPTTDDAQPPLARISAELYDSDGLWIGTLFDGVIIPANPSTSLTLLYLESLKHLPMRLPGPDTLSRADFGIMLNQAINTALGTLNDAAVGIKGRISTSKAPLLSTMPIAIENSDPRGIDISSYASFAAMIAAVGSTPTTFNIASNINVASSATVPPTLTLRFLQGGSVTITTGQTLTISGPIIADPVKIFYNATAGLGTVSILSRTVQEVYPEWWGASPTVAAATNTPALQAAIIGAYGSTRTNGSGLSIYNRILKLSGMYDIDDTLNVYHVIGFRWEGQTKFNSGIRQNGTNKKIINGQSVTYGVFSNLIFISAASQGNGIAMIDLDYDGSQGADLRPQNITFQDCVFQGSNTTKIGVWLAKHSGSQGDNIRFRNCYANGFTFAAVILGGNPSVPEMGADCSYNLNAVNVIWDGGDLQGNPNYGLASYGGSWTVDGATFENGSAGVFTQTGFDVYCEAPVQPCSISNTLHESMKIAAGVQNFRNVRQQGRPYIWYNPNEGNDLANTLRAVDQAITGTAVGGDGRVYRITVAGTMGGLSINTASSGSATTIVKAGSGWTVNAFVGYRVSIQAGTGKYQYGIVTSNTATTITLSGGWITDYQNITIASPDATSTFVVEPNWGTQFTSGGVTWVLYDFNVIEGQSGGVAVVDADGLSVSYGGLIKAGSGSVLRNMTVPRHDWLWQVANSNIPLDDTIVTFRTENIYALRDVQSGATFTYLPWKILRNGFASTPFTDITQNQQGTQWTLFDQGQAGGGSGFGQVGIGRGDGVLDNGGTPGRNILGYLGHFGRKTPFGTDQAGLNTDVQTGLPTGSGIPGNFNIWAPAAVGATGTSVRAGQIVAGVSGRNGVSWAFKGADVASASAIVPTGNLFHVTGTTNITSITATGIVAGSVITIIFDGVLTFTDGSNLKLAGNFVTTADDVIHLVFDGSAFYEICRSVN